MTVPKFTGYYKRTPTVLGITFVGRGPGRHRPKPGRIASTKLVLAYAPPPEAKSA